MTDIRETPPGGCRAGLNEIAFPGGNCKFDIATKVAPVQGANAPVPGILDIRPTAMIRTVTGQYLRASEIARLRPIFIGGKSYTEVRGRNGKFLGVIDGAVDSVVTDLSEPSQGGSAA